MSQKLILYSSLASQWANVPKLGLLEKEFEKDEVEVKEIDLLGAENFDPGYLKINSFGTVPSLVIPASNRPLTDSHDILKYLDELRGPTLTPTDKKLKSTMMAIVTLVHSDDAGTNLILLQARDMEEYECKRTGAFGEFIATRQKVLENHHSANPEHPFYGPKVMENGALHRIYTTKPSAEHARFFEETQAGYVRFAAEIDRLETLLILPYAAGEEVTHADLHAVPWLAHAMAGVETKEIGDLSKLEYHIRKSVPDFKFGPKTHKWWGNYTSRTAFKEIYPQLH